MELRRIKHKYFADESQKIWFIGDSKYYKDSNDIKGESLYKQFTYAKNVIQYNINELLKSEGREYKGLRYRDELTEGYSVTPNFFIRGEVPAYRDNEQFGDSYFRDPAKGDYELIQEVPDDKTFDDGEGSRNQNIREHLWEHRNRQFQNRLFDRDTLLLQVYNVNFLYVLKAFTAKSSSLREEFKHTAREKFRKNFLKLLRDRYYFWIVWVKDSIATIDKKDKISAFVDKHYRILQGKLFRTRDNADFLVLALEKVFVQKEGLLDDNPTEFKRLAEAIKGDCEVF